MRIVKLSELFDIDTGKDVVYADLEPGEYLMIGHKAENNGVVCTTQKLDNYKLYKANSCITLGHIGNFYATVQPKDFYIGTRVKALIPKKEMTFNELMYYTIAINANSYRFSYGRVGGSRIQDLMIPADIPDWVYEVEEPELSEYKESFNSNETPELNINEWQEFKISDLFNIVKGSNPTLEGEEKIYPYISSTASNNGISDYKESKKYHSGNVLTVSANGSCMDTFYQSNDFISCGDVNVLYPIHEGFNQYIAIFLIPILELHKFRFGYGRKSNLERVKTLTIKLPVTNTKEPDYEFMEEYIKTLSFSIIEQAKKILENF